MATARFLECVVAQRPMPTRLVVASSMSIYGEGEYVCAEHGRVAPGPRPEEQLLARSWETIARLRAQASPSATSETKPLIPTSIYAINKRDHEEMCLVIGAAYGIPTVALRFFNVYGPGQALSNPYTGVAAIFASRLLNGRAPVIFEDGAPVARLHPRLGHRPGHHARARVRGGRRPGASTSAPAGRRPSPTSRTSRRRAGSGHRARAERAVPRRRHPPLLRRHDAGARAARLRGAQELRGGHDRAGRLAAGPGRRRPRETPRPRSWPPAAWLDRERRDTAPPIRPTSRSSSSRPTRRSGSTPCLTHGLRARRGRSNSTSSSSTTSPPTARASSWRDAVPAGARRRLARTTASRMPTTAAPMTCDARYVLFLNPDTEIVDGTFGELVAALDERPDVGLAGVRQLTADGDAVADDPLLPDVARALGEALRVGALAGAPALGRRARARPRRSTTARSSATGPRARSCSRAARRSRRRAAGRALLHLLRGARPLPAHQAGGLDDPPPRRR